MTDFMLLFRGATPKQLGISPDQMEDHMAKWGAWIGGLSEKGIFKGGNPLDEAGKVLTGKDVVLTDGPYSESKDLVGGFVSVSADNIEAATEIAKTCPILPDGGSVEIRAIQQM